MCTLRQILVEIKGEDMGWNVEREEGARKPQRKRPLKEVGVGRRIILKCILEKWDLKGELYWTGSGESSVAGSYEHDIWRADCIKAGKSLSAGLTINFEGAVHLD
jgi:hypothetical protein